MEQNEEKIPFNTRFGLRLLQVLLIIFALLLVKRCVDIYLDYRYTNRQTKVEYFEKGYASGLKKARGLPEKKEPHFENQALKKAYWEGYRQGWDKGREEAE